MRKGYLKENRGMKMHQTVIVSNFGTANCLWSECLAQNTVATFEDDDLRPYFQARDKEGYIRHCLANKKTIEDKPATRITASTWYGISETVESTQGDIWIHRQGGELWWTTTTDAPCVAELRSAKGLSGSAENVYVIHKPAQPWSNRSIGGRPLQWRGLHPKAHDFLQKKQGTLGKLSESNARYALSLIQDENLDQWHSKPEWQTKAKKANYSAPNFHSPMDIAAGRMANDALKTVESSNGQTVERTVKNKESGFMDVKSFANYVLELMKGQGGRCKLSGLRLQFDGAYTDKEMLASLDRIDSNGHYEAGNLQVVCRFINFWKNASDNATFARLITVVQAAPDFRTLQDTKSLV